MLKFIKENPGKIVWLSISLIIAVAIGIFASSTLENSYGTAFLGMVMGFWHIAVWGAVVINPYIKTLKLEIRRLKKETNS